RPQLPSRWAWHSSGLAIRAPQTYHPGELRKDICPPRVEDPSSGVTDMFRKARFLTVVLGVFCFVLAQEPGTVTVQTERHPELGQYLVDGEGMSLYMYSADPKGESACVDACAEAWPPLVAAGELAAGTGVAQNLLGTLTRPDGTIQATYFGIPLYYSTLDAAPGDTSGLGVEDRKSTRLNSSHVKISYAVFCLKKKNAEYVARGHSNVTTGITGLRPHGVHSPTAYCSF